MATPQFSALFPLSSRYGFFIIYLLFIIYIFLSLQFNELHVWILCIAASHKFERIVKVLNWGI
jgi:hypothetical protein